MRAAIIGAGSAVGARVVEAFQLGDGPTVVALESHPARLALAARFVVELRLADPADEESLAAGLAGCGAAIHVADGDATEIKRMPVALCRAAAVAGVRRLVYLSSAAVHGWNPPAGTDEESPLHLRHADAETNARVTAEKNFLAECRKRDLAGYVLRPGLLYGPRCPLIAGLATALEERRAWLLRQGEGICNCVYLDNLVAAIRLALRAKAGAGQPCLITDAETVTWRALLQGIAQHLELPVKSIQQLDAPPDRPSGGSPAGADVALGAHFPRDWIQRAERSALATAQMAESQQCAWRLPLARAARLLGYKPPVAFTEGLRRSCAWWQFARGEAQVAA